MNILLFSLYSVFLLLLFIKTPGKISCLAQNPHVFSLVGLIGLYRYSLWLAHIIRALFYENVLYKNIRKTIDLMPEYAWKPKRLYFIIASFREEPKILYASIKSIIQEAKNLDLPATLCIGTASGHDEKIVCDAIKTTPCGNKVKVVFIRQDYPNKRLQMGYALRSLVRQGLGENDPVVFMDGDSVIQAGSLRKCLPVFALHPDVDALTTNEKAVVINSGTLENIYNLRFALRNLHMQSLARSKKLLCLTGRFSVFRGKQVMQEEFISRIEHDSLDDWFWGKIKFLSGDDKSTWFTLLKNGSNMLYVPDACIYSIEKISEPPLSRYIKDLRRWGGNMLRNNKRALQLGPEKTGIFPRLILTDQKFSMWTAIMSPFIIIMASFYDLKMAYVLLLWVLLVKYLQTLVLFYYGRTINWTFPFILYVNQVLNGLVKIYMLLHLRLQSWNNRPVFREARSLNDRLHFAFAKYLTAIYLVIFLIVLNFAAF